MRYLDTARIRSLGEGSGRSGADKKNPPRTEPGRVELEIRPDNPNI